MSVQIPPTEDTSPPAPRVVVVMGVSGCGKSTVGALLALHLRWEFEDADWFHPACNVDKMHSGIPLTDEDRVALAECGRRPDRQDPLFGRTWRHRVFCAEAPLPRRSDRFSCRRPSGLPQG